MPANRAVFYLVHEACTGKKLAQETTSDGQVSCASQLVEESGTRFLTESSAQQLSIMSIVLCFSSFTMGLLRQDEGLVRK